jgi:DNA polymerase II small subunit/DNA polymerase delta subunit B
MLIGHFHQSEYIYERDIHIIQCGSFEGQTPYLKRKGIMPKVGGWIIEFKVDSGFITRFKQEFITFKNDIPNDF